MVTALSDKRKTPCSSVQTRMPPVVGFYKLYLWSWTAAYACSRANLRKTSDHKGRKTHMSEWLLRMISDECKSRNSAFSDYMRDAAIAARRQHIAHTA
jgi:hypothetical protein